MVQVQRSFGPSTATLTYVLRAGSPRLDVVVDVDWHHQEHLLSIAFPLDVRADTATCGIQFGAVRRPTHASSSWDAAKFEVCAHRYVDVAEPSFGVAVLNDGRYGHHVFDGAVRVSLVRGARYPDPDADQGRHAVTVSLFPHGAGLADVVAEAERLDLPGAGRRRAPVRRCDRPGGRPPRRTGSRRLVVRRRRSSSPAPASRSTRSRSPTTAPATSIVRLHEACGDRAPVTVASDRRITAASRCNLLEEPAGSYEVSDGIVATTLRPFELLTLRLTR